MTKPGHSRHSKASTVYEHSANTNNGVLKCQQPNHYGFLSMDHNKSHHRPEYQQDAHELRIATIAALSQQIKGKDNHLEMCYYDCSI